ncbi:MAG: hypothetical protein LBH44_06580 [Treponema sp.]|nr:hypothetical protein [Treponema sp.]
MIQKDNSGKAAFIGVIVAAVCIVIYLAALIQASVRLYLSIEQHKITADMEFEYIADLASSAGVLSFMDDPFIETMNHALAASKSLEALIISGPEGEYAFERKKGHAVAWVNNSPRFINRFYFSGQSLYKPLYIQGLRNVNIQGVAGAFDYAVFSAILKETLFLILIGFVLAFFTMLFQSLLLKSGDKAASADDIDDEEIPLPVKEEPVIVKKQAKKRDSFKSVAAAESEESEPKGLYSPRTNIGWAEYTKDRLDSELHRCASTEKDLVMIEMEFSEETDDAHFKHLAEEAAVFFTSRDLLFENGSRGISIIYPGIDLETGISKSEKFKNRITEKYPNSGLYIGLSSRLGRLLNAGRLMLEAMEALQRAKADPDSSIIAFKSDPDKYRAFIAHQNP